MEPLRRSSRITIRPFSGLRSSIVQHWKTLASGTLGAIVTTTVAKGSAYDVAATITNSGGDLVTSGAYDSSTGIHAEIAAIDSCPPSSHATLSVSPPPCKRCAAILAYYRTNFGWTVQAPKKEFASTYLGAYYLPDFIIDDVLVAGLVAAGKITRDEAAAYRQDIVTEFCGGSW